MPPPSTRCCVDGCPSTKENAQLYSIPRNKKLRVLWLYFLCRTTPALAELTKEQLGGKRVCHRHFESNHIEIDGNGLLSGYPTLFSGTDFINRIELPFASVHDYVDDHSYSDRTVLKDHSYSLSNLHPSIVTRQNLEDTCGDNEELENCLSDDSIEEPFYTSINDSIEEPIPRSINESVDAPTFTPIPTFNESAPNAPKDKVNFIDKTATWFMAQDISEEIKANGLEIIFVKKTIYPEIANHPYLLQILIKPKDESGGIFSEDLFQSKMKPIIVKLYKSNEARVRLKLLDCFSDYVHTFTEEELKHFLLPEILKGMQDVDKTIVRATLLCLAHLVEILGPQVVIGGTRQELFIFHEVGPREELNEMCPKEEINESAEIKIESNDDSANETDCDNDAENEHKKKGETETKISKSKHCKKYSIERKENNSITEKQGKRKVFSKRKCKYKKIQDTEDSDDDTDSANESENDEFLENHIEIDNYGSNTSESVFFEELHRGKRRRIVR